MILCSQMKHSKHLPQLSPTPTPDLCLSGPGKGRRTVVRKPHRKVVLRRRRRGIEAKFDRNELASRGAMQKARHQTVAQKWHRISTRLWETQKVKLVTIQQILLGHLCQGTAPEPGQVIIFTIKRRISSRIPCTCSSEIMSSGAKMPTPRLPFSTLASTSTAGLDGLRSAPKDMRDSNQLTKHHSLSTCLPAS